MSNETRRSTRRPYQLKARARRKEEVHKRITEAAVYLHETLGPARTTMEGIATLAGVQRATVYNHFPSELELFEACSSHWFKKNPPPDPSIWISLTDPVQRVWSALEEMYAYYNQGKWMLSNVLRDASVVPAMDEIRQRSWEPMINKIAEELACSLSSSETTKSDKTNRDRLIVTLVVAFDFFTWQRLHASGFSDKEAAALTKDWVTGVTRSTTT